MAQQIIMRSILNSRWINKWKSLKEFNQVWKVFYFHFFSLTEMETNENKLLFDWQHHKLVGIGIQSNGGSDLIRYYFFVQLTIEFNKINNDKLLNNNFNAIPKICESTRKKDYLAVLQSQVVDGIKQKKKSMRHEQQIIFHHRRRMEKKNRRTRKMCISNRCQFDWYLMCLVQSIISSVH